MDKNINQNGVNNESEVVKKVAPPPMKRAKKGEQSAAVAKAAKKAEETKKKKEEKMAPEIKEEAATAPVVPEIKEEVATEVKEEPVIAPVGAEPKVEIKEEIKPEIKEKAKAVAKPEKAENKKPVIKAVPVKEKISKKNLKIIIPIVAVLLVAVIIAVVLVSGDDKTKPVVVTDEHGVPMTDVDGNVITVTPETDVVVLTDAFGNPIKDADGKNLTTIIYEELTAKVPVTDMAGALVTDASGNAVTEVITVNPNSNGGNTTNAGESLGTTAVLVTDGQGNTGVDSQGNLITTIVNITETPTINIEPAKTQWKNTQGGSSTDKYEDVILTSDGCYITLNVTSSVDGDFSQYKDAGLRGPYSVITKFDKEGSVIWQKAYGSTKGALELAALSPCSDGSFYAVGYGKAIEDLKIKGWYDGAIYRINKDGAIEWVNSFGTSTVDILNDVITTKNGDAVVVGSAGNNDGDASDSGGKANESKAVIMRYSKSGKLLWKEFAGGNMDTFVGVAETQDGSIMALGNFYSGKMFPALGKCDSGLVKYSSDGVVMKQTAIAGSGIDEFKGITATSDGGVVICGSSNSADAENSTSFFKNDLASRGGYDSYIIKYTNDLTIKFATPLRGQNNDVASSVVELDNGTYVIAGSTNSSTRDFKGVTTRGKKDIFVASFNNSGTLIWVRSFGGTENDGALALCKGADGGYVVAGETFSNNVDLNNIAPYSGNGKASGVMVKFPE